MALGQHRRSGGKGDRITGNDQDIAATHHLCLDLHPGLLNISWYELVPCLNQPFSGQPH